MLDILGDPSRTGAVIVAAPEEMPVNETLELAAKLKSETVVDLAAVVVNRVLPELFGRGEEEVFNALVDPSADPSPVAVLEEAVGGPVRPIFDGARLAVTLRRTRGVHLARLRDELPEGTPLLYVPYLFQRSHGVRATRQVAEHLREEVGY
jgi:anion-transporting  ArsA/GET3 family ATPase